MAAALNQSLIAQRAVCSPTLCAAKAGLLVSFIALPSLPAGSAQGLGSKQKGNLATASCQPAGRCSLAPPCSYAPKAEYLPLMAQLFTENFRGMRVETLSTGDPRLKAYHQLCPSRTPSTLG
jgi:hypothetical protein